ncbi:MAG: hypothetical protein GVY28_10180, partial [Alphaproteobacteria bacterium]|nr:hypothetical protein [Alphaproteobacteria bacterium]
LSLEPAPAPLAETYRQACAAEAAFHARLRAAVVEALSVDGGTPDAADVDRALAAVACPRCGCPLAN